MRQMVYKGIPMEVCPRCFGLWMGDGDLARLLEMAGPPVGVDLSKIGKSLATVTGDPAVSRSSDAAELMQLSMDVIDGLGRLAD